MRINQKGFFLAEVLIVSTVLVLIITVLYIQISNLFNVYTSRLSYNQVDGLYALSNIRDYMKDRGLNSVQSALGANDYMKITCATNFTSDSTYCNALFSRNNIEKLYFSPYNVSKLKTGIRNDSYSDFNRGEQEFIDAISIVNENKYRLIASFADGTFATLEVNINE